MWRSLNTQSLVVFIIFCLLVGISILLFCIGIFKLIVSLARGNSYDSTEAIGLIVYGVSLALILWLVVKLLSAHSDCGGNIPCGPAMPPPIPPPPLG
jgi:hypothetical protein